MGATSAMIGGGLVSLAGGLIGSKQASEAMEEAMNLRREYLAALAAVPLPDIEKMKLAYEMPELVGQYSPILEEIIRLEDQKLAETDPRLREMQIAATSKLREIAESGLTAEDLAALRVARRSAAAEAEAKQKQLTQEMAARGISGSGIELASRLQGAQSAADRLSAEGDRSTIESRNRALAAALQSGQLGGQIRAQDLDEMLKRHAVEMGVKQFNVGLESATRQRNIAALNQANLYNLQQQQRIAEAQTALRNQQQAANKALLQQQFSNLMQKAGAQVGQGNILASALQQQGAAQGQMWAGIGAGAGQMLGSLGSYLANQQLAEQNRLFQQQWLDILKSKTK